MNQQILRRARHRLVAEKTLLELTSLAVVAGVFLLVAPRLVGGDPLGAIVLTVGGAGSRAVLAAITMLAAAALCGALTAAARPAAMGVAMVMGLSGLSLYSTPLRTLLWQHHENLPSLYATLAIELLVVAAFAGVAMIVGEFTRRVVGGRIGRLAWRHPLAEMNIPPAEWPEADYEHLAERSGTWATALWGIASLFRRNPRQESPGLKHRAICAAIMIVGGAVLAAVLCRTGDRKQVLFAVFAGFALAAMAAHQFFPTACSAIFWVSPIIVGLAVYGLAASACGSLGDSAIGWLDVPYLARALPVDWLTAGSGGGLVGYLVSARLHEGKILEHLEELAELAD